MKRLTIGHKLGQEHKPMSKFEEYIYLNLGVILIAVGVYFFKFPNNFAIGGVSGISVLLNAWIPSLNAPTINFILNMIFLVLGIIFFGKNFGFKTAYATIMLSVLIKLFEYVMPISQPLTNQPFLELIYAVLLPGIGGGLLFNIRASSGGTDVLAMILKKFSSLDIGRALFMTDVLITGLSFVAFGPETGLLASLGLFTKSALIDITIENMNRVKFFTIVTEKPDEILNFIKVNLHRGGTIIKGKGVYLKNDKTIINVVVNNYEGTLLRDYAEKIDPHCFITILKTSEIIGKGFHYVT
ncbi:MAG: YitT family protein [Tissierellia bacterium]|nr:YitT family protein [Tissierellia bacterium]